MNTLRNQLIGLAILATFTVTQRADAYIDSGSGSLILQAALSGILGGLFVAKSFWATLVSRRSKSGIGGKKTQA